MESESTSRRETRAGSAFEVLRVFLLLGCTCFGGPIAHIGYFRREFVERRRWLDDTTFTDLFALCQFLPGPASSQVGFSIGLLRAGWWGGAAAWLGFTLPSAILMAGFARLAGLLDNALGQGLVHGLKLVAVAVVAQAIWDMARRLCADRMRAAIALAALGVLSVLDTVYAQIIVIGGGALIGSMFCRISPAADARGVSHGAQAFALPRAASAAARDSPAASSRPQKISSGAPSSSRASSGSSRHGVSSGMPRSRANFSRSCWHSAYDLLCQGLIAPPRSVRLSSGITSP